MKNKIRANGSGGGLDDSDILAQTAAGGTNLAQAAPQNRKNNNDNVEPSSGPPMADKRGRAD